MPNSMTKSKIFSVFIIEDESSFSSKFIESVLSFPHLHLKGFATTGKQALNMLLKNDYDIAFLDICLPSLSGIEIVEILMKKKSKDKIPAIIFITAYKEYLEKAFEYGVIDYLVKPFSDERLEKAINRAKDFKLNQLRDNQNNQTQDEEKINHFGLAYKLDNKVQMLDYDKIKYLNSEGNYTIITLKEGSVRIPKIIKHFESRLPEKQFIRIHRQFILNLSLLSSIGHDGRHNYTAFLNDEEKTKLSIGRKYLKDLKKLINIK